MEAYLREFTAADRVALYILSSPYWTDPDFEVSGGSGGELFLCSPAHAPFSVTAGESSCVCEHAGSARVQEQQLAALTCPRRTLTRPRTAARQSASCRKSFLTAV